MDNSQEWGSGDDVSTEDLRVALRRYRSFFDRLLLFSRADGLRQGGVESSFRLRPAHFEHHHVVVRVVDAKVFSRE